MDELNDREHPPSRTKKNRSTFTYIAIVIVSVFVVSFYFYVQKPPSSSFVDNTGSTVALHETQPPGLAPSESQGYSATTKDKQTNKSSAQPEEAVPHSNIDSSMDKQPTNPVNSVINNGAGEINSSAPSTSQDIFNESRQRLFTESNHQQLINEINTFYTHLDRQPYMQRFGLKESSKVYFSKLLQKLVNNPPVVIGETGDLFTLLQNTSHFFRILGKNNITMLKVILTERRTHSNKCSRISMVWPLNQSI